MHYKGMASHAHDKVVAMPSQNDSNVNVNQLPSHGKVIAESSPSHDKVVAMPSPGDCKGIVNPLSRLGEVIAESSLSRDTSGDYHAITMRPRFSKNWIHHSEKKNWEAKSWYITILVSSLLFCH
jgi:hypothetical protein